MSVNVQMDPAGRVVRPKKVRERTLALEVKGDAIQLRPQRSKARLERVSGVLVLVSDTTSIPLGRDLIAESREDRLDQINQSRMKVFCDTSVLVAAFLQSQPHHNTARPVVERVKAGKDDGVVATHSPS